MSQPTDKLLTKLLTVRLPDRRILLFGVTLGSAAVALIASFVLSNWAEASTFHHGIQHVLLFVAGTGVGSSLALVGKKGGK